MNFKIEVINHDSVLKITAGLHRTLWGDCLISQKGEALCGFHFCQGGDVMETLGVFWPGSEICYNEEQTGHWVDLAIQLLRGGEGEGKTLLLMGTPFQLSVWKALMEIEAGNVCSYQDIARKIGRPSAVRAVGTAVGKNRISLVIPCHRVIREDGKLGGYAWGVERKQALLDYEKKVRCES